MELLLLLCPEPLAAPRVSESAAVEDRGRKPLTATFRGKPMVRMRVCSFSRAVVAASSTLVCLQCSTWEVLLALKGQQEQQLQAQQAGKQAGLSHECKKPDVACV